MRYSRGLVIGGLLLLLSSCTLPGRAIPTPASHSVTEAPPLRGSISITDARADAEAVIFAGRSTLPEATCLQTQLFIHSTPVAWWPINACVPVNGGAWEQRVPLGAGDVPPTLDPTLDYTLRAWAFDDPDIQSELFWLELSGPATPPPPTALPVTAPDPDAWPSLAAYPLEVGAQRVYSVTVDEDLLGHWTGLVTETITGAQEQRPAWVFSAEVTGHPLYTAGDTALTYVVFPDRVYRLQGATRTESIIRQNGVGYEFNLIYRQPLAVGDHWGPPDIGEAYHWWVTDYDGCYRLELRTNPDHTFLRLCEGQGMVSREYGHHGSRHDERWTLETLLRPR